MIKDIKLWFFSNRLFSIVSTIVVIGLCIFSVKHTTKNDIPPVALTVTKVAAKEEVVSEVVQTSGIIAPIEEAIISSEISGQRIIEVLVNVGDTVKKGQVLAKFNTSTLIEANDELASNWSQADANLRRAKILQSTKAISAKDFDAIKNQEVVAKSRLDASNLQLNYANVTAPEDGIISARSATRGIVTPQSAELFRIILGGALEWRGELTPSQLLEVKEGQDIDLTLPDNTVSKANVRKISPTIDSKSGMTIIYATIKPGSNAKMGMYADGKINIAKKNAILVPVASVLVRDGHSYVCIIDSSSEIAKVTLKKVTTGGEHNGFVEIISGLNKNEFVVLKGAGFLNDGDIVRIVKEKV